jgi:hypothetical protein
MPNKPLSVPFGQLPASKWLVALTDGGSDKAYLNEHGTEVSLRVPPWITDEALAKRLRDQWNGQPDTLRRGLRAIIHSR